MKTVNMFLSKSFKRLKDPEDISLLNILIMLEECYMQHGTEIVEESKEYYNRIYWSLRRKPIK